MCGGDKHGWSEWRGNRGDWRGSMGDWRGNRPSVETLCVGACERRVVSVWRERVGPWDVVLRRSRDRHGLDSEGSMVMRVHRSECVCLHRWVCCGWRMREDSMMMLWSLHSHGILTGRELCGVCLMVCRHEIMFVVWPVSGLMELVRIYGGGRKGSCWSIMMRVRAAFALQKSLRMV